MDTIVILGAGQFGRAASRLSNLDHLRILAFGDNAKKLWGTAIGGVKVCSVEDAVGLRPDLILIGVTDRDRTGQLKDQALRAGFTGRFLLLGDLYQYFDIRSATLLTWRTACSNERSPATWQSWACTRAIPPGS